MNKFKKYLKPTIIFLVIFFIGYLLYLDISKKNIDKNNTVLTPKKPSIPNYIETTLPIEINNTKYTFPNTLPFLKIRQSEITKAKIIDISKKLGFTGEPNEFDDVDEGKKYYWNNETHFMTSTPKNSLIKFGMSTNNLPNSSGKRLTNDELKKISLDFLTEAGLVEKDKIIYSSIIPYKISETTEGLEKTTEELAKVYQINFRYKLSDFEILNIDPNQPLVFVQILPDGTIFNTEVKLLDQIEKGITEYKIKNIEDIKNNKGEIRIVSINNDYIPFIDLKSYKFEKINIDSIKLVYLLDSKNYNELQPVFLMEGNVKITNSTANRASFYLPAFK